jgi:hypothetical protein
LNSPAAPADTHRQEGPDAPARLGFAPEQVVQEFGYDDDVDTDFRFAIEDVVGSELEDEDYTGGADVALLWWRAGDGDLTDALVDMVGVLEDGGAVVLLTPKPGRPETVDASEIEEAATTTGLRGSGAVTVGDWRAMRLASPRSAGRK